MDNEFPETTGNLELDRKIFLAVLQAIDKDHQRKIRDLRVFVVDQIDKFLVKKSLEWSEALKAQDADALEEIRKAAHELVDKAMDYKIEEQRHEH